MGACGLLLPLPLSLAPTLYRAKAQIELQRAHGHNEDQRCHIPYNQLTLQAGNTATIPAGAFIILTGHVKKSSIPWKPT